MPDWRSMHDRIGVGHLRGKHVGTPAVILGSGPSTRFTAGREFKDRIVITVNSAGMLFPDADYYLTSDHGVLRCNHWKYVLSGKSHLILQHYLLGIQRKLGIDRVTIFQKDPGAWRLNPDSESLIFGFGSTQCAAHAAVIMGCSPVYLIGSDCRFEDGKRHFWQFPGFEPDDIDYDGMTEEEWHARTLKTPYGLTYPGDDGTSDNHLWEAFHGWEAIRKSSPEIDIRDVSGGIMSDVFPTATIDEALGTVADAG